MRFSQISLPVFARPATAPARTRAFAFFAILVWTSGQTIINVFHRIFGSGTGNVALSIAMLVVSLLSFVLAIYGHATLVASFRFIAIVSAGDSEMIGKIRYGGPIRTGARCSAWP